MSFNIRTSAMDAQDGENCWDNRKETVANIILNQRPAVAGLQVRRTPRACHYVSWSSWQVTCYWGGLAEQQQ
jgi:hypothetical protein